MTTIGNKLARLQEAIGRWSEDKHGEFKTQNMGGASLYALASAMELSKCVGELFSEQGPDEDDSLCKIVI